MRQVYRQMEEAPGRKAREPLAESHVRRSPNFFTKMSDEELISYAKKLIKEKKVKIRSELENVDGGLYSVLCKRRLMGRIDLALKTRYGLFRNMNDADLMTYVKDVIQNNGIKTRKELEKLDGSIYRIVRERGLLDRIGLEMCVRGNGFFGEMSDEQLVEYARGVIRANKAKTITELYGADRSLYNVLVKRGLIEKLGLEPGKRPNGFFKNMNDDGLIDYAKAFCLRRQIANATELKGADSGLHDALTRRNLLDRVFAELEQKARDGVLGQLREAVDLYTGGSE